MSFLDNLENSMKNMEAGEERLGTRAMESRRKELIQKKALATAPFAESLRRGSFSTELMNEATRIAHGMRIKVYITWLESTLRLEARDHRLELKPTPEGVLGQFYVNREPVGQEIVDLNGSAKKLAEKWLATVGPRTGKGEGS